MPERALLLSLRRRHAEAILTGHKTVEVRRRRVAAPVGTIMLMYATSPTRAIVGTALLAAKTDCSADEAWALAGEELALDRGELADYLRGSRACLLWLDQVKPLTQPLEIAELRQRASFRPPQSYRYVKADDPSVVLELTAAIRGQQRREVVGSGLYQASVTGESGT